MELATFAKKSRVEERDETATNAELDIPYRI
jgi:hypothetical protein